jgi:hypothetical protein
MNAPHYPSPQTTARVDALGDVDIQELIHASEELIERIMANMGKRQMLLTERDKPRSAEPHSHFSRKQS